MQRVVPYGLSVSDRIPRERGVAGGEGSEVATASANTEGEVNIKGVTIVAVAASRAVDRRAAERRAVDRRRLCV